MVDVNACHAWQDYPNLLHCPNNRGKISFTFDLIGRYPFTPSFSAIKTINTKGTQHNYISFEGGGLQEVRVL
jgi:hypothetical protein